MRIFEVFLHWLQAVVCLVVVMVFTGTTHSATAQQRIAPIPDEIDTPITDTVPMDKAVSISEPNNLDQPQALDIMLVLDNSGSMQKNDPQALMPDVVSAFATQLWRETRLGMVVFDEEVRLVLDLTNVTEENFTEKCRNALLNLNYNGKNSDIPAAVERALYTLRINHRSNANSIIVLVTDGIVDIGTEKFNLEQTRWLRNNLAKEAKDNGIQIFGIAFTEAADYKLIQSLSQTTKGTYYRILEANQIPDLFERILKRISPVQQTTREAKGIASEAALSPVKEAVPTLAPPPAPVVVEVNPLYEFWLLIGASLLLSLIVAWTIWTALTRNRRADIPYAQLVEVSDPANDNHRHIIRDAVTRVGRKERANDLVIAQDTVSAQHALIEFRNGIFYIRDLKSGNGTFLNGYRFSSSSEIRELPLKHLDRIRFDNYEFEFLVGRGQHARINRPVMEYSTKPTVMRNVPLLPDAGLFGSPDESGAIPKMDLYGDSDNYDDRTPISSPIESTPAVPSPDQVGHQASKPDRPEVSGVDSSNSELSLNPISDHASTLRSSPPPPHPSSYPPPGTDNPDADPTYSIYEQIKTKQGRKPSRSATMQGIAPPFSSYPPPPQADSTTPPPMDNIKDAKQIAPEDDKVPKVL